MTKQTLNRSLDEMNLNAWQGVDTEGSADGFSWLTKANVFGSPQYQHTITVPDFEGGEYSMSRPVYVYTAKDCKSIRQMGLPDVVNADSVRDGIVNLHLMEGRHQILSWEFHFIEVDGQIYLHRIESQLIYTGIDMAGSSQWKRLSREDEIRCSLPETQDPAFWSVDINSPGHFKCEVSAFYKRRDCRVYEMVAANFLEQKQLCFDNMKGHRDREQPNWHHYRHIDFMLLEKLFLDDFPLVGFMYQLYTGGNLLPLVYFDLNHILESDIASDIVAQPAFYQKRDWLAA